MILRSPSSAELRHLGTSPLREYHTMTVSAVAPPKESPWSRLTNWFWGYDYFISYHWDSGGAYAVSLAQRLRDRNYDVFLDRRELAAGDDWKCAAERAIRNTRRLVLVATRTAITDSNAVEHEVRLFTSRGRHVIPIVFAEDPVSTDRHSLNGLDRFQYPTLGLLPYSQLYIQDDHARLPHGPSDAVLERLVHTYGILRRRNVRAAVMGIAAAILVAFSAFSTASWVGAYLAQRDAEASRDSEAKAKRQEAIERQRADERAAVATSRKLAALSTAERAKRLDTALLLAIEALRITPTPTAEARDSLLRALEDRPGLSSYLPVVHGLVSGLAFSPDGKTIATGFQGGGWESGQPDVGGVILWDAATRRPLTPDPLPLKEGMLSGLAFSPDGKTLATGYAGRLAFSPDGRPSPAGQLGRSGVVLWDVAGRKRVGDGPLVVAEGSLSGIAFSPDGKTLATGFNHPSGRRSGVVLWDAVGRQRLGRNILSLDQRQVTGLAFSPDGKTFAAGYGLPGGLFVPRGRFGGVMLWHTADWKQTADPPLTVKEGTVGDVAYSPDGKILAMGCYNSSFPEGPLATTGVVLWDTVLKQRVAPDPLPVSEGIVRGITFSPDGKILAAAYEGAGGGVALWNVATRQRSAELPRIAVTEGYVASVAFSPSDNTIAVGFAGGAVLWDLTPRRRLEQPLLRLKDGAIQSVAFSPDGKTIAAGYHSGSPGSGGVVLWNTAGRQRLTPKPLSVSEGGVTKLAFSPDDKVLAAGYERQDNGAIAGGVVLWDIADRRRLMDKPLELKEAIVTGVVFNPDNKTLIAGYEGIAGGHGVAIWKVAGRQWVLDGLLKVPEGPVTAVAVSPDGLTLGVGYNRGVVLWDITAYQRFTNDPLPVKEGVINALAFSPDGKTLSAGYGNRSFVLDGPGGIVLWDVTTRRRLLGGLLTMREGSVHSVSFSLDGRTITAGYRLGVVLWETASRKRASEEPIIVSEAQVYCTNSSPDGKTLAAGCRDGVLLIDLDLESWQRKAAQIANRNLTPEEWQRFFPDEDYHSTFPDLPMPPAVPRHVWQLR